MDFPILVVKLGGSLLDWPGLPAAIDAFLKAQARRRILIVVGGGAIVDAIRDLDRIHQLGQERSHALALRAMDLTARVAEGLLPGLTVVELPEELPPCWELGGIPVLAPRRLLDRDDHESASPLPHHWDVTSDSISARIADLLGAEELLLLKSTAAPAGLDLAGASSLGLVDPLFPLVAEPIPLVSLLNLRDPHARPTPLARSRPAVGPSSGH
ncbi:amino acid kinase family protein [Tautonia sociabilis]|uniref:Uridylate kinase n=1 Tax=Tautonia sociabilis TaxID=2080755 RepID=A0A432MLD9_9BACT|nr:uridylate kinase [Tautonia sociabilis]RUL88221.1 uridylate kinase [Tautonia sociabilis]